MLLRAVAKACGNYNKELDIFFFLSIISHRLVLDLPLF